EQLRRSGGGFFRFPLLVLNPEADLLAENSAVRVDHLRGQLHALHRGLSERRLGARHRAIKADWNISCDGSRLRFAAGFAGEREQRRHYEKSFQDASIAAKIRAFNG